MEAEVTISVDVVAWLRLDRNENSAMKWGKTVQASKTTKHDNVVSLGVGLIKAIGLMAQGYIHGQQFHTCGDSA